MTLISQIDKRGKSNKKKRRDEQSKTKVHTEGDL